MDLNPPKDDQQAKEPAIEDYYRATLCHGIGFKVLADIMRMCHLWEKLDPNNPVMVAEYNIGQQILARCVAKVDETYELSVLQAVAGLKMLQ